MSLAPVLSAPIFQWFVPAQNGTGLVPAVGYVVKFYEANTATPKAIYTDPALTIPYPSPSNQVTLNSQGYATIYLGSGGYKITVSTPSGSVVFVQDNITSNGSFGTGFVNTVADLANVDTNNNTFTFVGGYYAIDDGGEGMFYNKTSLESSNGGYIFNSSFDPSKKWFRITTGDVNAAYFGYIPGVAGDQTSQLISADAYASTLWSARLVIQAGNLATITAVTFNSPSVVMQTGAQFNAASAATLTFNGTIVADGNGSNNTSVGSGIFPIFGTNITAVLSSRQVGALAPIAEWWGATIANPDNQPYFDKLWACGAGSFQINPGVWLASSSTPPTNRPIISYGILSVASATVIPIGQYYFTAANIHSLGAISAGGIISTPSNVQGTKIQPSLGLSNTRYNTSGRILSITGNATTSGASLTTLLSRTLLANSLLIAGDALRITASGFINGSGSIPRVITLKHGAGSATLFNLSGSLNIGLSSAGYKIILDLVMTGANTATWNGQIVCAGISAGQDIGSAASSFDTTIDQAIFVSAQCDSGSITNTQLLIEYFGA